MRRELRYGWMALLTIFVAPVCGLTQGPPTDKAIAVFGLSIHYWDIGSGPLWSEKGLPGRSRGFFRRGCCDPCMCANWRSSPIL